MNDDALLYFEYNEIAKLDATYVLNKYAKPQKWLGGANILDVGSGEGTISLKVLLPKLPANVKKLVLSDISEEMLRFAQKKCEDEKVNFLQMDISDPIPKALCGHFDHIFSFYCLQWVVDEKRQEQAWKNMFDLLKPGGDILVTIIANAPPYDFYENMAKIEKWTPFMQNVKDVISPYHRLKNPAQKLKYLLEKTGFSVSVCVSEERCYVYPSMSNYLSWALSVNPFIKLIPEFEHASFREEYKKQTFKHPKMAVISGYNGAEKVEKKYSILIACATKPVLGNNNSRFS